MDYLVAVILSLLTPFGLSMADVDYNTGFGVKISDSTNNKFLNNKVSAKSVLTGSRGDYSVLGASYFGPYGVLYDVSVEYKIYPFAGSTSFIKNSWIAPKMSYQPLRQAILIRARSEISTVPRSIPIAVLQRPSFGLVFGYDVLAFGLGEQKIAPYFGVQIGKTGYENQNDSDQAQKLDSTYSLIGGIMYQMDNHWALNLEVERMTLDVRAIRNANQDFILNLTKIKWGVTYYIKEPKIVKKANKDSEYIKIIESVDSNIQDKIEAKRIEEEALAEAQEAQEAQEEKADNIEKLELPT